LADLVVEQGRMPSLDAVAARAGVSKGGLLHHFGTRRALVDGLAARSVEETDAAMRAAADRGDAAATWLRLSVLDPREQAAARAMLLLVRLTGTGEVELPDSVAAAVKGWQDLIAAELGDPVAAEVVRLVGDGLFLESLVGGPADPARTELLVRHLLGSATPTSREGGSR
jgi:AcrR family transcriptional regulator